MGFTLSHRLARRSEADGRVDPVGSGVYRLSAARADDGTKVLGGSHIPAASLSMTRSKWVQFWRRGGTGGKTIPG